jgi:hypothetical protein
MNLGQVSRSLKPPEDVPTITTEERLWTPEGHLAYGAGSEVPVVERPGLLTTAELRERRGGR